MSLITTSTAARWARKHGPPIGLPVCGGWRAAVLINVYGDQEHGITHGGHPWQEDHPAELGGTNRRLRQLSCPATPVPSGHVALQDRYRRRGARKWLTDPHRRFFTDRTRAEQELEGADQEQWEIRIVEVARDYEPDYRGRLQLEGRYELSPWPDRPALRWTVYLAGGREGGRLPLYDTFSQERADHFAQTIIDILKEGFTPELEIPTPKKRGE